MPQKCHSPEIQNLPHRQTSPTSPFSDSFQVSKELLRSLFSAARA
jgi:hypothetical protein